jgi:cytochrome P450
MGKSFSPRLVRRLSNRIGELVDELLAPALDHGYFDAVVDMAFPLPVLVVCELIGIPDVDRDRVRPWATDLTKAFAVFLPEQERAVADQAVVWLRDYVGGLLDERHKVLGLDLLSRMIAAEEGEHALTRDEIVDNIVFLFFAGFETTMNLIATGCAELLRHPEELARLQADRSLLPTAVEEFLRYDAPIQNTARLALEPIEIGGRTIKKGRVIHLLLGSANRDERQFVQPERIDVGREPNPHLSFGGGIHHCLGASLARVEATTVFARLLQRFAVLEPAGAVVRRPSPTFRSYTSIPVRAKPA